MTELERRAQLGDKEAQEECTRQGILLPCPFCGCRMKLLEGNSYFGSWMTMCVWCGAKTSETGNKVLAIAVSNRRPAPSGNNFLADAVNRPFRSKRKD